MIYEKIDELIATGQINISEDELELIQTDEQYCEDFYNELAEQLEL